MKKLLLFTLLASPVWAALPAGGIWEINTSATAANVNAGGFNTGNASFITDYTATSATGNAAVVASATYTFVAGDVGAWLYIKSGTNWTADLMCPIASVSAGAATLNSTAGACTQRTGGAWAPSTVAGIASTASPTAGTIGIDYSRGTASIANDTDLASLTGTTVPCTVTSVLKPFGLNHAGNFLHINSGTNWTADWYEVVSVSVVTATLDKACASAATVTAGTFHLGGAMSMAAASLDTTFFGKPVPGNTVFIKAGTYAIAQNLTPSATGTISAPLTFEGYTTVRGDKPTPGGTQPIFDLTAANVVVLSSSPDAIWQNFTIKGKSSYVLQIAGTTNFVIGMKVVNISTSASQEALYMNATGIVARGNDISSYRGRAIRTESSQTTIFGNYIHDSDVCVYTNSTGETTIIGNLIVGCVTTGINFNNTVNTGQILAANTLYNWSSKVGTGINIPASAIGLGIINNIIDGWTTGISHATSGQLLSISNYNDYFNNTTNFTNGTLSTTDKTLDPTFASVTERSGSTATTTAGNHLVQSGATFVTWAVTPGVDFLYVSGGTGPAAGVYGITSVDSETQITADVTLTANATGDKTWRIIQGHNFAIGTNLKALGFPSAFSNLTSVYMDIGAAQRQESGGGGTRTYPIQ